MTFWADNFKCPFNLYLGETFLHEWHPLGPTWGMDFYYEEGRWKGHLMNKDQQKNQYHHIIVLLDLTAIKF